MIRDLHYLKESFQRHTETLLEKLPRQRWGPASLLKFEEDIVLAAYELQKLLDEDVLPGSYMRDTISLNTYDHHSTLKEGSHWRDFKLHYTMSSPTQSEHPPLFVCHQLIHNAVFSFDINSQREITGLFVTSTHQRKQALYRIDAKDLAELFAAARDALAAF